VALGGSGTWTSFASPAGSGGASAYNVANGATITVTTPTDFPGGTVALGFISWTDAGGATISGTVNGTVYSLDTSATGRTGVRTCSVLRIPNVPAGAASYVFTTSATTGGIGTMFDYWQWEPDEAHCPLVVLVKQPHPLDYTGYGASAPTDASVDIMNTAFDTLAAEFGARVITADTSAIDNDATCFIAGNVHPNLKGHLLIAQAIRDTIKATFSVEQFSTIYAPRVEYGAAAPTGVDRTYYVGDRMINSAPAIGSAPGWICTTAGTPGTWQAEAGLGTAAELAVKEPLDGNRLTVGESTIGRFNVNSGSITMTSQSLRLAYFTARKSETVASVRLISGTAAGATPTLGRRRPSRTSVR